MLNAFDETNIDESKDSSNSSNYFDVKISLRTVQVFPALSLSAATYSARLLQGERVSTEGERSPEGVETRSSEGEGVSTGVSIGLEVKSIAVSIFYVATVALEICEGNRHP